MTWAAGLGGGTIMPGWFMETIAGSKGSERDDDDTDTIAGSTGMLPPTAAIAGSGAGNPRIGLPKLGMGGGA
jgi:hypothetical protein